MRRLIAFGRWVAFALALWIGTTAVTVGYDAVYPTATEQIPMTEKTMTWTSGGTEHTLKCTKSDGESAADFAARCKAELDAQQAVFPPD